MRIKIFIILMFTFLLLVGCQNKRDIYIEDGHLFIKPTDDLVRLNGEWLFYWNQLLSPENVYLTDYLPPERVEVPGYWHRQHGYGTYRLTIHLSEEKVGHPQALYLPKVYTAYRIWINDRTDEKNGIVAQYKESEVPYGIPRVIYFTPTKQEVEILLQVSNYHYRKTGISGSVYFGDPEKIGLIVKRQTLLEWFSVGALLIIAVNQLNLFLNRKKDRIPLYLGLFCFLVAFRVLLRGNSNIFDLFPTFNWEQSVRFDYLILFIGLPLFVKYFSLLFPNKVRFRIFPIYLILSSICGILIVLTSTEVFTNTIFVFYFMFLLLIPYLIYVLISGVYLHQEGAKLVVFFLAAFICTAINDMLHIEQVINTIQLTSLGLVVFCGAQSFLVSKKFAKALAENEQLSDELETTQREIVFTLGEITETRSKETGNHVRRVALYCRLLALKCGLSNEEAELIKVASPMHDVGKIAIPDLILNKPGKLTEEEFDVVKTHTTIGYQMLMHSNRKLLEVAAIIAYTHHEKYDGSGYPRGIKGEEIPLFGRITAIADVFDALSTERVYKKAWDHEKIIEFFKHEKGKHFDPELVNVFLLNFKEFISIKDTFKDNS